jgi:hypothetical protein
MLSIGVWRWYINITITILDIIHRTVFYLKHGVSETGLCLFLQVEPIHMGCCWCPEQWLTRSSYSDSSIVASCFDELVPCLQSWKPVSDTPHRICRGSWSDEGNSHFTPGAKARACYVWHVCEAAHPSHYNTACTCHNTSSAPVRHTPKHSYNFHSAVADTPQGHVQCTSRVYEPSDSDFICLTFWLPHGHTGQSTLQDWSSCFLAL